jgi:hypothetical protein
MIEIPYLLGNGVAFAIILFAGWTLGMWFMEMFYQPRKNQCREKFPNFWPIAHGVWFVIAFVLNPIGLLFEVEIMMLFKPFFQCLGGLFMYWLIAKCFQGPDQIEKEPAKSTYYEKIENPKTDSRLPLNEPKEWTHYMNLKVAESASITDIKDAYRKLAATWHPDRNSHRLRKAEFTMKIINQSYAILKDPVKRKHYDERKL